MWGRDLSESGRIDSIDNTGGDMMNKYIVFLALIIISFTSQAENEATYNATTGVLHIPKVIVEGNEYWANLVHQGNLNFLVTKVELISEYQTLVGTWSIPSGGTVIFRGDGSYYVFEIEDGDGCFTGIEIGTYNYNPVTRKIEVAVASDENGDCGFAADGVSDTPGQIWVEGNTLFVVDEDGITQFPRK